MLHAIRVPPALDLCFTIMTLMTFRLISVWPQGASPNTEVISALWSKLLSAQDSEGVPLQVCAVYI
jgi:hypothetical protein